jgi:hypothetical protein
MNMAAAKKSKKATSKKSASKKAASKKRVMCFSKKGKLVSCDSKKVAKRVVAGSKKGKKKGCRTVSFRACG